MANPRKFSEKIALQKQKQAEGTAEFEKIMKEVYATKRDDGTGTQRSDDNNIAVNGLNSIYSRESRGRSVGVGPMRRPSDRKVDRSPYSGVNTAYLSPPSDSNWRRTNSDSAIHQSLQQQTQDRRYGSQTSQRKLGIILTTTDGENTIDPSICKNSSNMELRKGMQCDIHSSYKTIHDNVMFNPMANTGSLPDLTSLHFSTIPLLDKDPNQYSSPFSSSTFTTSPTMVSPTAVSNRYHCSPSHSPNDSSNYSPTHYTNYNQNSIQFSQYRQSHADQTAHTSYITSIHNQQDSNVKKFNISNTNAIHGSHGQLGLIEMQPMASPGSSPGLLPATCGVDSRVSSPGSPVLTYNNKHSDAYPKQNNNQDSYGLNPAFQNHFEQFSLIDNSTSDCSSANLNTAQTPLTELQFDDGLLGRTGNHTGQNENISHYQTIANNESARCNSVERSDVNVLSILGGNLKLTHDANQMDSTRHQHMYKHTPRNNTSTSIPEIVFSDFSTGPPDFSKEIFDSLDLELGALDMQMLSDPNSTIADPTIEDSFRRDLT